MLTLALAAAAAEHPEDEVAARTEAIARYGKEIPWAALCWSRPQPWDGLAPLVVGVSRAATGCETYGVVVGGAWSEPEAGLALVPEDGWKALAAADREARAVAYVDQVLLAFAEPDASPAQVSTDRGGRITVVRRALRRDGKDGRAATVTRTVVFGPDRRVATSAEVVDRTWETVFHGRPADVVGLGGSVGVQTALSQVGGGLERCVDAAWRDDMTLAGFVKLQWTVEGGTITGMARVDEAAVGGQPSAAAGPLPEPVVRCLGDGVRRVTWPADAAGTATWTFLVERR